MGTRAVLDPILIDLTDELIHKFAEHNGCSLFVDQCSTNSRMSYFANSHIIMGVPNFGPNADIFYG